MLPAGNAGNSLERPGESGNRYTFTSYPCMLHGACSLICPLFLTQSLGVDVVPSSRGGTPVSFHGVQPFDPRYKTRQSVR